MPPIRRLPRRKGGEFAGFDIDLGRAIARELGVKPVFVNASFDGIFPALQNGSFDIVLSAVTITPERRAVLLFSDPYIDAGQLLAVRKDQQGINGPDDLAGKRVGVQINTTAQFDLEKRPASIVAKYNTIDLALLDLQNGRVDAVVSDAPVLRYMTKISFRDLKTAGEQFTDEKLGHRARAGQRRSEAGGERGAVEDRRQRRVRARSIATVVRRGAPPKRPAAAADAAARGCSIPSWSRAPGASSCAACG